jgi:sec-independent protein translocase protein TatA
MLCQTLESLLRTQTIPPAFFQNIGVWEVVVILLVVLLLFGGAKLPELARGLGRALRIFKEEVEGIKKSAEEPPKDTGPSKDQPAKKDEQPPGGSPSG